MIEINELTKRYGDILAVDGLTFTVRPGRVTGFLGPNGSGKSTTLRMLLGLNTPTSGTATFDGRRYREFGTGLRHVGALLDAGDPPVLIFDEPVNGLDPEGIRWARELFRSLAAEGRTVFVSSHMMSEMANTADHLIVIGGGRLIADEPAADFAARATTASVTVRTPDPTALTRVLRQEGASVLPDGPGVLSVTGLTAARRRPRSDAR
ncbi:ATP-binding cassette domain-containing protein [Kitasatospora sp. NPDC001159]